MTTKANQSPCLIDWEGFQAKLTSVTLCVTAMTLLELINRHRRRLETQNGESLMRKITTDDVTLVPNYKNLHVCAEP